MGGDDGEPGVAPGPAPERLTGAEVTKAVDDYLAQSYNNADLELVEVMEFDKQLLRPGHREVHRDQRLRTVDRPVHGRRLARARPQHDVEYQVRPHVLAWAA